MMKYIITALGPLTLLLACGIAIASGDIYQEEDVGTANGRRFWYPEWRMQELVKEGISQERKLDEKIAPREREFYLTDDEIEKVLQPQSPSSIPLERRIEMVLGMRGYDGYGELNESEEEVDMPQPQKGQQRQLRRQNMFNRGDGKRGTNKRGNNNKRGKRNGKRGKRNNKKNKRGKRGNGKRGTNKHQTMKYVNKQYKNICLDPPDRYRTCLSREVDPTNDHIGCDTILRNSYNMGAQFIKKGKWPPPSDDPTIIDPIVPYQEPYLEYDEILTDGFMHITLLQSVEKLNCDERIRVEETILRYLQQNVGDDDTFKPMCVFLEEDAVTEEIVRNADGRIAGTTALKVDITYRTKKTYAEQIDAERRKLIESSDSTNERHLLNLCSTANHHLCCSQDSINANQGAFCNSIGCNFSDCRKRNLDIINTGGWPGSGSRPGNVSRPGSGARPGSGSRPGGRPQRPGLKRPQRPSMRHARSIVENVSRGEKIDANSSVERMTRRQNPQRCYNTSYKGKSMEQVLKQDTVFKNVEVALSLLNDTDTSTVASCSVNWYIVKNNGIPSQTCEQYDESDCRNNEDLEYEKDSVQCIEPSSAPSQMPSLSAMPSYEPTDFPTISSTGGATSYQPTDFPTMFPTEE